MRGHIKAANRICADFWQQIIGESSNLIWLVIAFPVALVATPFMWLMIFALDSLVNEQGQTTKDKGSDNDDFDDQRGDFYQ